MIPIGTRTLTVSRACGTDEIEPLRAELAALVGEHEREAAEVAAIVARIPVRQARVAAIHAALLQGVVSEQVEAEVVLDEATGEVVDLYPVTGVELARAAPSDDVVLGWLDERVESAELKAAAAKLAEGRGITPAKEG